MQPSGAPGPRDRALALRVFSFSKTNEVWGLRRSATICMIEWWIERTGPKPYLLTIQQSYEHGIDHGNLEVAADKDKAELRDLVPLMLETRYESSLSADADTMSELRRYIVELYRLLGADLEGTSFHQPLDEWTVKYGSGISAKLH